MLDAFLIEVFPLYSVIFTHSYYGGPLLGVVLAVAREYELPSFDVCLPCDAGILGGFSGCFSGFFLVGFGLFGPGAARALAFFLNIVYRFSILVIISLG